MITIVSRKEFLAGLLFAAIGAGALGMAVTYRIGTPTEMGPGFFPMLLSILLIALGLGAAFRASRLAEAPMVEAFPIGATILVLGGVVAFGILLPLAGLVPATAALVLIACLGRMRTAPIEAIVLALALAAMAAGLFVFGLGLPFRLF